MIDVIRSGDWFIYFMGYIVPFTLIYGGVWAMILFDNGGSDIG